MSTEFLPIILGSDENAYGMARAFHQRYGIKSLLVCRLQLAATKNSRILDIVCIDRFDSDEVFLPALVEVLAAHPEPKILIPCSDRYLQLVVQNSAVLEPYIANRFISSDLLDQVVTKQRFYELCDQYGLRYPQTVVCPPERRLQVLEELPFGFPMVIKANNSNSFEYLHSTVADKQKAYFVRTADEFTKIMQNLNASDYTDNLIIQEFIPGDDTAMRVMNCYSNRQGKVKLMCLGHPILEEYTPLNAGNYAAIISDSDTSLYQQIQAFLEEIGFVGFSNFDLKFDNRTGQYVLFEINPRQGRSSFYVTAAGYNMAEFIAQDVIFGEDNEPVYADKQHLWLSIPKSILYKYVQNAQAKTKLRQLIRSNQYTYTLFYKPDFSVQRWLRMQRYLMRHHQDYKQYYFDKGALSV
ncbi:MAG: hypothetical protein LBG68_01225 [Coriobacteriales bacterium]|nr:hypothetical protein [Coriobacteriales bacterium]